MKRLPRLEALEKVAAANRVRTETRARHQAEDDDRMQKAWAVMESTMSPEHVALIAEAREQWVGPALELRTTPAGRLLSRCFDAISYAQSRHWPHNTIPPEVALAMPPVVAEVYLQHDDSLPLHDCEACGYRVPHRYFDRCPLCGGKTGWYAYSKRLRAELDAERPSAAVDEPA